MLAKTISKMRSGNCDSFHNTHIAIAISPPSMIAPIIPFMSIHPNENIDENKFIAAVYSLLLLFSPVDTSMYCATIPTTSKYTAKMMYHICH